VHDDVVERPPFGRTLELDRIDRSTGQPPRLAARQQGEQIRGADLSLEMAARRSAMGRKQPSLALTVFAAGIVPPN
jgi:hypothetical protein